MMRQTYFIFRSFFVGVALVLILSISTPTQNRITVAGTVVDDSGKPVKGATIFFYQDASECNGCHDQVFPLSWSGNDGEFFLDDRVSTRLGWLYIFAPFSSTEHWPLAESVIELKLRRFPEFRGIPVKSQGSEGAIDLGMVKANIANVPFSIDLRKLFKSNKDGLEELSSFKISVRYKGVTVWDKLMIDARFIKRDIGEVKLALPVGKWKLDFWASDLRHNRKPIKRSIVANLHLGTADIHYPKPLN